MTDMQATLRKLSGFRCSVIDVVVLTAAALAAASIHAAAIPYWWLTPMVVGHFFLFCNVFRVRRNLELLWSFGLLINAGSWMWRQNFDCAPAFWTQLPATLAVLVFEIRSAHYHGIFASRLNPNLHAYLSHRISPQRGDTSQPGASDAGAQPQVVAPPDTEP